MVINHEHIHEKTVKKVSGHTVKEVILKDVRFLYSVKVPITEATTHRLQGMLRTDSTHVSVTGLQWNESPPFPQTIAHTLRAIWIPADHLQICRTQSTCYFG